MKKTLLSVASLFFFAVFAAAIYSSNAYAYTKLAAVTADTISKKGIALKGSEEVPPVTQSGYGTLDVSYDKSSKTLKYTANWYELSDTASMMHFHGPADKGTNAGVIYPITEFTHGKSGTATGTVKLDGVKLKEEELLGGKWYFNIHTKTHPAGEIRGQVIF